MKDRYDVIVIGAGNAGLTAAATLSMKEQRVLLFEKNGVPGGSATSFVRGRFEFECALHELASVGTKESPGSVYRLFDQYGIDIDWQYEDSVFRVIADGEDGYDVTLPVGREEFCDAMEKAVPGCRESVYEAFLIADRVNRGFEYLASGNIDPKVLFGEHADFCRAVSHSVDECFDALGMPKKAQNIMKTYWPYLGTSTAQIDMGHYMAMVDSYVKNRPAMPRYRSHELSLSLEKFLIENGVEIRYNSPVEKIITENGRAVGVIANGEEIYADNIVANLWPDTAYKSLLDPECVSEKALKLAGSRKPSSIFFAVYLGLDKSAEEIGLSDYSVFLYDSPDAGEQYESSKSLESCFIVANCLNCTIPDATPKGTSSLFITTMLSQDSWGDVKPEDYKRIKNDMAEKMIRRFEEKLNVRIRPHIEEIVIAAPPTFARYLGTPGGTPYGYEMLSHDRMTARIMNASKEQFIKNLYFVGAHSERGDGYSSTYANGNSTAGRILREVKENGKA